MAAVAVGLAAVAALSGGTSKVPQTPSGPEGMPTPFLGVAVIGSGGPAAAVDAYGSIVELRAPGPAGHPFVSIAYKRQRAGSVGADSGIVIRASAGDRPPKPLWESRPQQRYLDSSNVLETRAQLAGATVRIRDAMAPHAAVWAREILAGPSASPSREAGEDPTPTRLELSFDFDFGQRENRDGKKDREVEITGEDGFTVSHGPQRVFCRQESPAAARLEEREGVLRIRWAAPGSLRVFLACRMASDSGEAHEIPGDVSATVKRVQTAAAADAHAALADATTLAPTAPAWADRLHRRSILTLLALSDRETGATPAGVRDHWHYIWPRDAATVAFALSQAGLTRRAAKIAGFVTGLEADRAARFNQDGSPVEDGRHEQGDGAGWVRLARRAAAADRSTEPVRPDFNEGGNPADSRNPHRMPPTPEAAQWRNRGDYGERDDDRGDYLANAIVAGAPAAEIEAEFAHDGRLIREAGATGRADRSSPALDTAAAWAVRPFPRPKLYPLIRATLLELTASAGPYGLFPASDWTGRDPWTAATASTAWSLAALGERRQALRLIRAVERAATPLGLLPERADIEDGLPRSTTPLAWSHAFALLALQELWPPT